MSKGIDSDVVQCAIPLDVDIYMLARLGPQRSDIALLKQVCPSGMFIPLHRHDDIECLCVTSGRLDVYSGDRNGWFTLNAGNSIVVMPNEIHAIRNTSSECAVALAVVTVRLASFIRDLGEIAAAAGRERPLEERRSALRDLAEGYGYWLASDTESEAIRDLHTINA